MSNFKQVSRISGLLVFLLSFVVYYFSAESSGSLWDCGEFILAAHKLEVVHPPGAPLFMLIGRMFTWFAQLFSDNPTNIAFAVNLMSGMFSAFTAMLVCWSTIMFGKLTLKGREEETSATENIVLSGAGIVGGLTTAFCSSIWFSAVEGEVYAMSTFFTAITFWAAVKWYFLPDNKQTDRWIILSAYCAGLSIGVHLLSILTFPAIALLYYFKKSKKISFLGIMISMALGVVGIVFVMKIVVAGIPGLWKSLEVFMVNDLGMPVHSGLIPTILIVIGLIVTTLKYAHSKGLYNLQLFAMAATMVIIGFSCLGIVVIRANADTPINMNVPSDATRLLPYLNREQYGERPLLFGPTYVSEVQKADRTDRLGLVGDKYKKVDEKLEYVYKKKDKILFPRIGHGDRKQLHDAWRKYLNGGKTPRGKPGMKYNLGFFWNYQIKWMYVRYFMWNFAGKQNGEQGYYPWDLRDGNWESGIPIVDNLHLYDHTDQPDSMLGMANNHYYLIPFLLGFIGFFYHSSKRKKEFFALLILFLITGIGIIIYSNQPPNEPRERDYVLVGSFFTFCMWIGMSVVALYGMMRDKLANLGGNTAAIIAVSLALVAPILMGTQNYDDHSRRDHYAARDYAANFLNSCAEDAIIFTYGDNDTYPLWYAQEVENIRRDVRVVNLSLIQVDWYINKLRAKVNDSDPIKLSIPAERYRGNNNNQLFFYNQGTGKGPAVEIPTSVFQELGFVASGKNVIQGQNFSRSKRLFLPIDQQKAISSGFGTANDSTMVDKLNINFKKSYIQKDELAIMDIIASNMYDRPIYFAVTCKNEKLMGLNDYMELEGLALRLTAHKNRSDENLMIYGSGRMNANTAYDNIMNKWKWGNFDKGKKFVNTSYMAEVQAMRMVMLRTAISFATQGESKKASDISKKYFEAFPHQNFPYETQIAPFINVLIDSKEYDEAKKHLRILGQEAFDRLSFIEQLEEEAISSFENDYRMSLRAADDVLRGAAQIKDDTFKAEMTALLGEYSYEKIRQQQRRG